MLFFLDSASIYEMEKAKKLGYLEGVTTNPSLIKKETGYIKSKEDIIRHHREMFDLVGPDAPVSLEVIGNTYEGMIEQALRLYDLFHKYGNPVIKIPVNPSLDYNSANSNDLDGLRAIEELRNRGVPINTTLIFTPEQAILAALSGASYVSPFVGREDHYIWFLEDPKKTHGYNDYFPAEGIPGISDRGIVSGIGLLKLISEYLAKIGSNTKVLGASIRTPQAIAEAKSVGCDAVTVPFNVLERWDKYELKDITAPEIEQSQRELHLDEFLRDIDSLTPEKKTQFLRHPKTLEGMIKFTEDTIPEYAELLKL